MERIDERLWRWGAWHEGAGQPVGIELDAAGDGYAASREVRFLQFNICGSACNGGEVERLCAAVRDVVVLAEPDVATLNEVCLAQADRLWSRLEQAGFGGGSAAFAATAGVSRCPGPPGERWYGNALLSRRPGIGAPWIGSLPNRPRSPEQRSVLSMRTRLGSTPVLASVTHLVQRRSPELNDRQIAEVFSIHRAAADAGQVVLFGGDLNATPEQVGRVVGEGAGFVDLAVANPAPTLKGRKIDYFYLDARHFRACTAKVERLTRRSDHRCLYGRATLGAGVASAGSGTSS